MLKNNKDKNIDIHKMWDKNIDNPFTEESIFKINNLPNPILSYILNICFTEDVVEMKCCFYRVSQKQLKIFERLQEISKLPKTIDLILSDSIKHMVKGTANYLEDNDNFQKAYINTHAKYAIIKTKQNNNYFIISSGNSNPDGKIEQLSIYNDCKIYNNISTFINDCLDNKIVT